MQTLPSWNRPPRVAVIEDDELLAMLLRYNIEAAGAIVECSTDGRAALRRLQSDPPDAVLLDWELPSLSGIEILRQLRLSPATRELPILMLTGRSGRLDRAHAQAIGIDAYLVKPFSIREVLEWLGSMLGRDPPRRRRCLVAAEMR